MTATDVTEPTDLADEPDDAPDGAPPARPYPVRLILEVVIVIAALVAAVGIGWLVRGGGSSSVSESSVDAGFARDMATHHTQAVIMAGYVRDTTTDPEVKNLAFDIESSQNAQIGEMTGWLDAWGLSRSSSTPMMAWMDGHDHGSSDEMAGMDMGTAPSNSTTAPGDTSLMPGMATPNELTKLETMTGPAMDVYFLQLMLRHHIGGIAMAQYAADHAKFGYVRNLAQKMVDGQANEITVMKQMLAARGAQPL